MAAAENTRELRERIKRQSPKTYLSTEHLDRARLLPSREAMLDALPKGGVVAEVGVGFGEFSQDILTRCAPRELHLIDQWATERYRAGRAFCETRFATEIALGRVVLWPEESTKCLAGMPDRKFDWIYLDSDHTYATTARELELAAKKVRRGGRIAGHDWTTGNCILPWPYGVIEATNEFCVTKGWRYEFMTMEPHGHQSFCLVELPRPRRRKAAPPTADTG